MKKFIVTLILALSSCIGFSQSFTSNEEAYSALIFTMSRYVEWETVDGNFDILVLNNSKIAEQMKKYYASKKVNGASVNIIEDKNGRTDFAGIEMLITNRKSIVQDNLLTININDVNGIINFVEEDGKIKIKIKKSLADKSKLKISNQLISIVQIIE